MPDVRPVLLGNAHHLGDHEHRQRCGQVLHDVHPPFGLSGIEEFFDGVFHKAAPCLHGSRREIAVYHLTHFKVFRTVVLDELISLVLPDVLVEPQVRLIDARVRWPRIVLEDRGRKQLMVSSEPDDIIVAGNYPQLVLLVPVDRVLLSQLAIVGIGIGDESPLDHTRRP